MPWRHCIPHQLAFSSGFVPLFNSDISQWDVRNVDILNLTFTSAASFRQDLCPWGTKLGLNTSFATTFSGTACPRRENPDMTEIPPGPFCFDCDPLISNITCFAENTELLEAVDNYLLDPTGGLTEEMYGPIGDWCVGLISNFSFVFSSRRNPAAATFNEDISRWDTRGAITMQQMFDGAQSFNQGK